VVLSLPREESRQRSNPLRFYVIAMFGSVAALHPVDPADVLRLPEQVPGAYVSFRYEGQVVGLQGTLHRRDDLVRFRVSDGVTLPRRSSTRVELMAPVTVRRHDGTSAAGMTLDVGLDGVLVESELDLAVGEEILLSIAISTREAPVDAAARVARTEGDRAGVAFTSIDQEARRFLVSQIFERSLADLRRRQTTAGGVDDDVF